MSEDRLDRALQEMTEEDVDAGTIEAARARVWTKMTNAGSATCAEFRQDFPAYLTNELGGSRRVLLEDHLGRCAGCRARIAEMKGERPIVAMPRGLPRRSLGEGGSSSRWVQRGALAAAAVLFFALLYLGRDSIDAMMAPGGPRATVVSADGGLYRLAAGSLEAGAAIGERESVRTGPGAHAVLRLADGSVVDVNERTEFFVTTAWSGQAIHLQRGDIIVKAAKQRRGRLRVLTRDSVASVKGTVFAVSAGMGGSVVSVVEGSVAVNQPGKEVLLSPGQQAASIPALASSVATAVSWSPEAESYLALLASFVKIERELANFPDELRTRSTLLSYLPASAVVYGAFPNPGVTINRALSLAEEQSAQNAAFGAWWNSETGQLLRQLTDRIQTVNPLLGDEIVFCASLPGTATRADRDGRGAARQAGRALERTGVAFRRCRRGSCSVFGLRRAARPFRLGGAPGVGARSPGTGCELAVCGGPRKSISARRGLAYRHGRAAGGEDGGGRRCAPDRIRRHDRDELRLRRATGACRCGRERGHVRVPRRTNRDGVVAG